MKPTKTVKTHLLQWQPYLEVENTRSVVIDLSTIAMVHSPVRSYRTVTHGYATSAALTICFKCGRPDLVLETRDAGILHHINEVSEKIQPSQYHLGEVYEALVFAWEYQ